MARKVQVVLEDDIHGGLADETVYFALDGTTYEIDLSESNARALRDALSTYIAHARKVTGQRSTRPSRKGRAAASDRPGQIRAWARANGIEVNERGRIPADLAARYDAAH
jgi:hypothetical protein